MQPTLLEFYRRARLKQTSWSPHYLSFMDRPPETNIMEPTLLEFYRRPPPETNTMQPTLLEFYGPANLKQTSCSPHYSSFMDAPI